MNNIYLNIDNTILPDDFIYTTPEIIQSRYIDTDASLVDISLKSYDDFKNAKLTIKQLKEYCKKYKQKISGNKLELKERLLVYFIKVEKAKIIQKAWRLYIIKSCNSARGPARFKRDICLNETDFFTTETMRDIPMCQYISFKDTDDRVYGFNILSLYNLSKKSNKHYEIKNPYNRKEIPTVVINNMFKIIRLSKVLNENIKIEIEPLERITQSKKIELRAIELFQYIDNLGNYTDHRWFLSLGRFQTDLFIKELFDIWNYRSQIPLDVKREDLLPRRQSI